MNNRVAIIGAALTGVALTLSIAAACAPDDGTLVIMPDEESTYEWTDQGVPCWQDIEEQWTCLFPAGFEAEKPTESVTFPTYSIGPCKYEDSDNCYWDAARMGNGQGKSFVALNGVVYYEDGE